MLTLTTKKQKINGLNIFSCLSFFVHADKSSVIINSVFYLGI